VLISVLTLQLDMHILVLISQIAVELRVLPRIEALGVCPLMLFINLVVNVAVLLVELFMLPLVTSVL